RSTGLESHDERGPEGVVWLMQLAEHFHRHAWLNPEPPTAWWAQTIRTVRRIFPMFPLTLAGLGGAGGPPPRPGRAPAREGGRGTGAGGRRAMDEALPPVRLDDRTALLVLTGAGVSAESGLPTYRGAGSLWRSLPFERLASPAGFHADPALVWRFYSERREAA